jgi:four helix bundle protein
MTSDRKSYKNLLVWQKGLVLTRSIYHLSHSFPQDERFALVVQMRLAAVSVPSNIAEGQSRPTLAGDPEFLMALWFAELALGPDSTKNSNKEI